MARVAPLICLLAFLCCSLPEGAIGQEPAWTLIARHRIADAPTGERVFWALCETARFSERYNADSAAHYATLAADAALTDGHPPLRFLVWDALAVHLSILLPDMADDAARGMAMLAQRHPDSAYWGVAAAVAGAEMAGRQRDYQGERTAANIAIRKLRAALLPCHKQFPLMLRIGAVFEEAGSKIEAFRAYLDARQFATEHGDPAGGAEAAGALAAFCEMIDDLDRADAFRIENRQLAAAAGAPPAKIQDAERALAYTTMVRGDFATAQLRLLRVVDWALANGHRLLADEALGTLRTGLLEAGKYTAVRDIYIRIYPDEVRRAQRVDPFLYDKLQVFFALADSDTSTALARFAHADSTATAVGAGLFEIARFRQLWGETLRDAGDFEGANLVLQKVYWAVDTAGHPPFIADAAEVLDSVSRNLEDYRAAYFWAAKSRGARAVAAQAIRADDLVRSQLAAEEQTRGRLALRDAEALHRRHNLQWTISPSSSPRPSSACWRRVP